ncbi:hypothetical protein [Nonomuraea insulae]|uniref:Secreted protein n=1 Tax=Nonomuraea insulae TaxID=1616787 RepID=A0ABW1CLH7_9ACTN
MSIRIRLAGITAAAALAFVPAAATIVAGTDVAWAAPPCWNKGGKWWCDNRAPVPVFGNDGRVVDTLRTSQSIFKCRAERHAHGGGGPHPNRWEYTQGDDHGAWGWVKDSDIYSETNPLPGC